jgi:hypothetical protein
MGVKISSLELENVKRVRAVRIEPTSDGLTVIGGRNNQGKTSVLDAIAWALGGNKRKPVNPNRDGAATPARLRVELDNGIVVERRGRTGALHVTDESGRKAGQALLDEFVSQLALDLPRFMAGSDADKATALLQTLGIDAELARLDGQIRGTYQDRQLAGRDAKAKRAHADRLPHHDDAPEEPVSVADLVREQQDILARNGENQRRRAQAAELARAAEQADTAAAMAKARVAELERQLGEARDAAADAASRAGDAHADADAAARTAKDLTDESTAEIEASIASVEETNTRVRENQAKAQAVNAATAAEAERDALTDRLEDLRGQRRALLDGAPLPLDGLSIDDDGRLTYMGQTWRDMSGSEQLRVATAVVRAGKPECGFVLVDKLEQLDAQTLAEFGSWAEGEGLQVIGTRVATDGTCDIVIEDGRVEGHDEEEAAPVPEAFGWDGGPEQAQAKTQATRRKWKEL